MAGRIEKTRQEIEQEVSLVESAVPSHLAIASRADFMGAIEFIREIKRKRCEIEDELAPEISNAHKTHKGLVALRRRHVDALDKAEGALKKAACGWVEEEKARSLEEADAQAASALAVATAMRQAKADELRSTGDARGADAVLGEPLGPLPPVVRRTWVPVVPGVSFPVRWGARVADLSALVAYCAANPKWVKLLQPNQKELNRLVLALRGNLEFPGVVVTEDTGMSVSVDKGDGEIWDR